MCAYRNRDHIGHQKANKQIFACFPVHIYKNTISFQKCVFVLGHALTPTANHIFVLQIPRWYLIVAYLCNRRIRDVCDLSLTRAALTETHRKIQIELRMSNIAASDKEVKVIYIVTFGATITAMYVCMNAKSQ